MLSLAKLTLLASDENETYIEDKINEIDTELALIAHQEDLPPSVLLAYGYDPEKVRVMTPAEIIKLLICEENESASEIDYKYALDLLDYVDDELERTELRHAIWCSAILRDSWTDVDPNSSIDAVLNLLFFKLVDMVECSGGVLEDLLPPLSQILEANELGDLKHDSHFQYLLRLGYNHFEKLNQ